MKANKLKKQKLGLGVISAMLCVMSCTFTTSTFADTVDNSISTTIENSVILNTQNNLFNSIQENLLIAQAKVFEENQNNYNCVINYPVTNNTLIDNEIEAFVISLKWSFHLSNSNRDIAVTYDNFNIDYKEFQIDDNYYTVVFNESRTNNEGAKIERIYIQNYNKETGKIATVDEILENNLEQEKIISLKETIVEYLKYHLYGGEGFISQNYEAYKPYLTTENIFNHLVFDSNSIKFYANPNVVLPNEDGVVDIEISIDYILNILGFDFFMAETEEIIEEVIEDEIEEIEIDPSNPMAGVSGIFLVDVNGEKVYKQGDIIDPDKPMVALTYDDGPSKIHTNRILDALEKHNTVATFFDIGKLIDAYPEIIQRQVALGCEIGNHTYYHDNYTKLSVSAIKADIEKTNNSYMNAVGYIPTLFRPPYGSTNATVRSSTGLAEILWSIDTKDWQSRDANKILDTIYKEGNLDGQVILMHGIYESTAKATEILIPYLLEKGYQVVNVTDLLEMKYGVTPSAGQSFGYNYFN